MFDPQSEGPRYGGLRRTNGLAQFGASTACQRNVWFLIVSAYVTVPPTVTVAVALFEVATTVSGVRKGALRDKGASATMRRMAMGSQRRTELLRGVLDLCLLAVVDESPAYGYEMTKRLRDRGLASVGEGSIYPLLGRLERDGLVETYRAASNGGPPRKYYRPSNLGRLALELGVSEWRAARDAVDAVLATVKVEVAS